MNVRIVALGVASALAITGCAHSPRPTEQVAVARTAIDEARQADAGRYAPVELASAREKLVQAERAILQAENDRARGLAEQAELDARLAAARARSSRSQEAVSAIESSIRTLREELDRAAARQ